MSHVRYSAVANYSKKNNTIFIESIRKDSNELGAINLNYLIPYNFQLAEHHPLIIKYLKSSKKEKKNLIKFTLNGIKEISEYVDLETDRFKFKDQFLVCENSNLDNSNLYSTDQLPNEFIKTFKSTTKNLSEPQKLIKFLDFISNNGIRHQLRAQFLIKSSMDEVYNKFMELFTPIYYERGK